MSTFRYMPDDWVTMRNALVTWASLGGAPAIWADQRTAGADGQGVPAPLGPFVRLQWVLPPRGIGQADRREAGVGLEVVEALASTDYTVVIDADPAIVVPSGATPTITTIRDALATEIDSVPGFSTRPVGLGGLVVVPDAPELPSVTPGPADALVLRLARSYFRDALGTLSVQVHHPDPLASIPMAVQLQELLETEAAVQALRDAGWAIIDVPLFRKADRVTGGRWEDRSAFDVRLGCRHRSTELLNWIEDVSVTGTVSSAGTIDEIAVPVGTFSL
jgi:hypothetical protein